MWKLAKPFLQEAMPELADELTGLLMKDGETKLAQQVPSLRIVDRCRCGDDFCSTIYTAPRPKGAWGNNHETIALDPNEGCMIIDISGGNIVEIEILYRNQIRERLLQLRP